MKKCSEHTLEYLLNQETLTVQQFTEFAKSAESLGRREEAIRARNCIGLANHIIIKLKRQINERDKDNH